MKKVFLFSFLLLLGLCVAQFVSLAEESNQAAIQLVVKNVSLVCLAFIMIHVGLEFTIDKSRLRSYGWDYFVAFTAAALPWVFCTLYFVYFFDHNPQISHFNIWIDALLLGRFASPTSAGILFSMLAAADLEKSWVYKKARVLAIFDDLDTIILLIPIKMLIVGFKWESILLLIIITALIYLAWRKLHAVSLPINWHFILIYSVLITVMCESLYYVTDYMKGISPVQLEILLPAFVLGCILTYSKGAHKLFTQPIEKRAKFIIAAVFMLFVGMSMPPIEGVMSASQEFTIGGISLKVVVWHVIAITLLSNLGKMFPLFCYRKEVSLKERLALSIGMCPRGEVGAGVIIVSLGLITNIDKSLIFIAILSLTINFILTGPFIMIIKKLLSKNGAKTRTI